MWFQFVFYLSFSLFLLFHHEIMGIYIFIMFQSVIFLIQVTCFTIDTSLAHFTVGSLLHWPLGFQCAHFLILLITDGPLGMERGAVGLCSVSFLVLTVR